MYGGKYGKSGGFDPGAYKYEYDYGFLIYTPALAHAPTSWRPRPYTLPQHPHPPPPHLPPPIINKDKGSGFMSLKF